MTEGFADPGPNYVRRKDDRAMRLLNLAAQHYGTRVLILHKDWPHPEEPRLGIISGVLMDGSGRFHVSVFMNALYDVNGEDRMPVESVPSVVMLDPGQQPPEYEVCWCYALP